MAVEQVLIFATRKKQTEFYLLASPPIVTGMDGTPTVRINKANIVAWTSTLAALIRHIPEGARVIGEGQYCEKAK